MKTTGDKLDRRDPEGDARCSPGKEPWVKPEITSFKPVSAARGLQFAPSDGISNLTP